MIIHTARPNPKSGLIQFTTKEGFRYMSHPLVPGKWVGVQADGVVAVVTLDGKRPEGCPDTILVREATKEELAIYRAVLEQQEDP